MAFHIKLAERGAARFESGILDADHLMSLRRDCSTAKIAKDCREACEEAHDIMNLKGIKLRGWATQLSALKLPAERPSFIDPWVMDNPHVPRAEKKVKKVDVLLCTHGHGDHIGDAVEICKEAQSAGRRHLRTLRVAGEKGRKADFRDEQGRNADSRRHQSHMVHADHSCGIQDGDEMVYGGEAAVTWSSSRTA